jgi:hypothetical protein
MADKPDTPGLGFPNHLRHSALTGAWDGHTVHSHNVYDRHPAKWTGCRPHAQGLIGALVPTNLFVARIQW